jgi:hypothetical protein
MCVCGGSVLVSTLIFNASNTVEFRGVICQLVCESAAVSDSSICIKRRPLLRTICPGAMRVNDTIMRIKVVGDFLVWELGLKNELRIKIKKTHIRVVFPFTSENQTLKIYFYACNLA